MILIYKPLTFFAAVPLTTKDMGWGYLPKTVTRMNAGAEPPGRVLRRA